MAGKIDLGKMSMDELKALRKEVDKAISGFKNRKRAEALKEVQAVAKKHGLSVDELVGKGKRSKARAPAKYRNPDDTSQTWSGRGRQPAWYKAALKAGKSLKSLEI